METFYFILAVPVLWALFMRLKFKATITWLEMGAQILVVSIVLGIVWMAGSWSQTHDTEIWNGQVTKKTRDHGHYVRSYDCRCYQSCSGSGDSRSCHEVCSTCYEDHYTVDWFLSSTIGKIRLKYRDSTSRRVYKEADPANYTAAYVSEPCSGEFSYTNYIKAVPDSLFNMADAQYEQFDSLIPSYPTVYGKYHVDHVITMGMSSKLAIRDWNDYLAGKLRKLGPASQANVIVVIVNTADQTYRHALETAWLGGKKNDVIVMAGVTNYPQIDWVDTITLGQNAGNSLMTVKIRDELTALGSIEDGQAFVDVIATNVGAHFDRKPMADFEYLKDDIQPATWVIVTAFILAFLLSAGLTWAFHVFDPFGSGYRVRTRSYNVRRFRRFK
jgi:hypothetical protein